ncbi:UNVERIFIED_CONTAM: Retrovirus-related Pol polyprotein from transposon RE2 [Sesamum radiatum]|uniref:Retrovirus-related Pol polyprotein from transposon RE2 n=1 Tax=Sesamum radiatum TaxID=300843 RepID=A0AAW2LMG0_SESRA
MNATFLRRQGPIRRGQRRQPFVDKRSLFCDHCRRTGHTKEACFKLNGYPKWYKNLQDQRKTERATAERTFNVYTETGEGSSQGAPAAADHALSELIRQEFRRLMQDSEHNQDHTTNLVDFEDFAGYAHGCKGYKEPRSFTEAQNQEQWRQAMQSEIEALEKNETWEVVQAPSDKKTTGCCWVYKLKLKPDGSIERYKVRLVAKGYNQIEGEDYTDCFAPVAKAVTIRLFLVVATSKGWPIHHLDVNNASLYGSLETIYMEPPAGYEILPGHVCKLTKSLYGLKQASRQWNKKFTEKIEEFGFVQSKNDYCLFTKEVAGGQITLLVYVDDILVAAPS